MAPRFRKEDERLLAAFREAALLINRELQGATPAKRQAILRNIESVLGELDAISAKYVQDILPIHFRDGSDEAIEQLKRYRFKDIDTQFASIHVEALQTLTDDSALRFANSLEAVRREANAVLTKMEKDSVIRELVQSEISGKRPNVRARFEEQGITGFQSTTRRWNLEDYSSMLTNTVLAEAHNTGAMTRYVSNGVEYGEVIERADAKDDACKWMNGKIVFLGDRRLLPPFHPNCYGAIKPFLGQPVNPIMSADDPRIPDSVRKMILRS